jgi:small subunit ribosomal protein S9
MTDTPKPESNKPEPKAKVAPKPAAPKAEGAAASKPAAPKAAKPAPAKTAEPVAAETGTATASPKPAKSGWWWGTGRRKRAVARVRIRAAKGGAEGKVTIQCSTKKMKSVEQYFAEDRDRANCYAPLKLTGTLGKVEVFARLDGGGFMGQAGALMMGLARALKEYDPALELQLRGSGMLTRDPREVERKKYGQAGARRRFQFSKR